MHYCFKKDKLLFQTTFAGAQLGKNHLWIIKRSFLDKESFSLLIKSIIQKKKCCMQYRFICLSWVEYNPFLCYFVRLAIYERWTPRTQQKARTKSTIERVSLTMMKGMILKVRNHIFHKFYFLLKIDLGIFLDKISPSYFNTAVFTEIFISLNR